MAADFAMGYDSVKQLAKEIGDIHHDFAGMIQTLGNLVDSLDGQWVGTAHDEFVAAYKKLRPKLNSISSVMGNYETAIRKGSDRQFEVDNDLAKVISGIRIGINGSRKNEEQRGNHVDSSKQESTKTDFDRYKERVKQINEKVPIGEEQYLDWCTGCSRATLIQRKQAAEGKTPAFSKEQEDKQNPVSYWNDPEDSGKGYPYTTANGDTYRIKSEHRTMTEDEMVRMLLQHPEGIMIYKESSPMHGIVITHFDYKEDGSVQFYAYDPVNARGDMGADKQGIVPLEDTWHYREGGRINNYNWFSYIG